MEDIAFEQILTIEKKEYLFDDFVLLRFNEIQKNPNDFHRTRESNPEICKAHRPAAEFFEFPPALHFYRKQKVLQAEEE